MMRWIYHMQHNMKYSPKPKIFRFRSQHFVRAGERFFVQTSFNKLNMLDNTYSDHTTFKRVPGHVTPLSVKLLQAESKMSFKLSQHR